MMEQHLVYELIGYIASVLVAISLMMSAIIKLRILNLIGACTFSVYGILIGSVPVAAMNAFIVLINIWFLWKINRDKEYFQLQKVDESDRYLTAFIEYYRDSISTFQPGFNFKKKHNFSLFILRNMIPAGLVMGNHDESGQLRVDLDFVIPDYRDFKIGNYLFSDKKDFFLEMGIVSIRASSGNKEHNVYLERIGFRFSGESGYPYLLTLK